MIRLRQSCASLPILVGGKTELGQLEREFNFSASSAINTVSPTFPVHVSKEDAPGPMGSCEVGPICKRLVVGPDSSPPVREMIYLQS